MFPAHLFAIRGMQKKEALGKYLGEIKLVWGGGCSTNINAARVLEEIYKQINVMNKHDAVLCYCGDLM